MEAKAKTCAFTGHRPQRLPFGFDEADKRCTRIKQALWDQIVSSIDKDGVSRFISGMAQGVDTWAAEIVLALKEQHPSIHLECALPCDTQTRNRSDSEVQRYKGILEMADQVTYVQHEHTKDCYMKRDRYMVDHADMLIAVWNGTRSGTGYTVEYAQQKGVPVTVIDPGTARRWHLD
ncbi:MAG: DUF1273 domain-containing protein [Clostridia bacterium]|nr:DUF1273 domain-containing protein [Clostridia bacterium]